MNIRPYQTEDCEELVELWRECGLISPTNDPYKDIQRKCQVDEQLMLLGELNGRIVASVMAGYEGHRGWVNYLAVAKDCRKQGLARKLMAYVEERLKEIGCPKINLQIRDTNLDVKAFYQAIGYSEDPVISMGKRLIKDD